MRFLARQIVQSPGAFSLNSKKINFQKMRFGIYDSEGKLVPHGDVYADNVLSIPHPKRPQVSRISIPLEGPVLFAGAADKQFGYFLTSGLGRLWALENLPEETRILYMLKPLKRPATYGFIPPILKSLDVENEVILSDKNHSFEMLYTASELFGERYGGCGAEAFYAWLDARWAPKTSPDPDKKVYVTRGQMQGVYGRYACEDMLEELLAAQGYEIFAPEKHSMEEQIACYQSAGRLIFSEGSALHLFALVKRPGQHFATIMRRPELPPLMWQQLGDRAGEPSAEINVIKDVLWPPRRGGHLSISILDFAELKTQLVSLGFLKASCAWDIPNEAQINASLHQGLEEGETVLTSAEREEFLARRRAERQAARKQASGGL